MTSRTKLTIGLLLAFIAFLAFAWAFKRRRYEDRTDDLRAEALEPRFERLKALEKPWLDPGPRRVLRSPDEPGAAFAEYRSWDPPRPAPGRRAVDLQPFGADFTPEQRKALFLTAEFLRRISTLDVRLHDPLPLAAADMGPRVNAGRMQILSTALPRKLADAVPADSLGLMAVVAVGLYPDPSWNYVFWDAQGRVAAGSLQELADPDPRVLLARTMKIELQQLLSLLGDPRCFAYECMNNASDGLEDLERQPLHLCAATLQKLCWNTGCDPAKTLAAAAAFLRENGLDASWYDQALPLVARP